MLSQDTYGKRGASAVFELSATLIGAGIDRYKLFRDVERHTDTNTADLL
jgi:hypothetical protein